jgi:hypothetical protein
MNRRAGGNENGRGGSRPQSNQRDESSDVFEVKALAANARSAASPVPRARAADLSGMVGRRDSVVGMRVDESPARRSGGVSWSWLGIGLATVLAPGLVGVWYLGHAGEGAEPAIHLAARAAAPAPGSSVEIKPIAHEPIALAEADPAAQGRSAPKNDPAAARAERAARRRSGDAKRTAARESASPDEAPAATAAPGDNDKDQPPEKVARADRRDDRRDDNEKTDKDDSGDKPAKVEKPAAPAEEAQADEEPPVGSPKTVKRLQATLSRLESRLDQCHSRFQVDGTAEVKVLVSPSGTVESLLLKGEFEGTPTGDCIVRQLSAASFPSFDGSDAIRISHSFSLE